MPSPVEYAVLLPARTQDAADLQLILDLHGGGGNRDRLKQEQPLFDSLWKSGRLPPGAVAALEPGIEPILRWEDMRPKHRFLRSDDLFERAFGKPADAQYRAANIRHHDRAS